MDREVERQTEELTQAYATGRLSRRSFVFGLLGLGISIPLAGELLAACSSSGSPTTSGTGGGGSSGGAVAGGKKQTVRFLIGPWTDNEVKYQQVIAAGYTAKNPNIKFTFQLYDWSTGDAAMDTSLAQGAHDIYYFGEGGYAGRAAQKNGFADLASYVNDPSWAAEKAKYLYWDRINSYGPKIMGLPICGHFEDALFTNMDMVKAAGFDETFVDSWDTFLECVTKMTKDRVYGLGIGIQESGFGEWYQRLRSAGGSYLTEDLSAPNVNTQAVVDETQKWVDIFKQGIAPPQGTFDYNTAPDAFSGGRMAIYSSDLTIAATLQGSSKPPSFTWSILPFPPGASSRAMFNDLGFYAMSTKMDQDLGWDVLCWWTGGQEAAYWADLSGTYPARSDAVAMGYGKTSAKQLEDAFGTLTKYGVGCEPFTAFDTVESQAEAQIADAYGGKISAATAVANVEKIVNHEVFGK